MAVLIVIVGFIEIAAGMIAFATSKSAIHEILGSVGVGFGVLTIAVAMLIAKFDDFVKAYKARSI